MTCGPAPTKSDHIWLVVAAFVFAGLDALMASLNEPTTGWAGPYALFLLQIPLDLSLIFAFRYPRIVAGLVLTGATLMLLSDELAPGLFVPEHPISLATVPTITSVLLCVLVRVLDRRSLLILTGIFMVLSTRFWHPSWAVIPFGLASTALPALGSLYLQARRDLLRSLRDRAERAEREQHLLAEQARAEERRRLAGEMHDVVTHRLSLMVLHAGALTVSSKEPAVRDAAEGIRSEGTRALDELRDLVGVLRGTEQDTGATGPAVVELPDPAMLVAESESVGIPVRLRVDGDGNGLSPTVARTAYRVVQEALTNVRKHAPGSEVDLALRYRPDGLDIEVRNSPPKGVPDPVLAGSGSGAGLSGLRQRVELIGGSLRAGPVISGGFEVSAILPAYVPTAESAQHDHGRRRR
ncbi:Signal transduction histidine kinase [Amycolatopsis xylanica]|uniref:histidine kinase n=1 Tax=Amycolatopsis xylanica TaxID=589385 RepID=A0A1H3GLG4_9PSEU|nr:histidine kinase [Amycolatopsis xylanica]SDY03947.1 Signal transduction histidine kinase [Amycolatopsis xylanica]